MVTPLDGIRIGVGSDIHRLEDGEYIILGGAKIPCKKKIIAHSDGDVLYHALADSLYGSVCLGDIGTHFDDKSPTTLNMNSKDIVLAAYKEVIKRGYDIKNIDCIITLETPKLMPYISLMRSNIAKLLNINVDQISIKAKTNEGLDAIGRGEAIKADVTLLIAVPFYR